MNPRWSLSSSLTVTASARVLPLRALPSSTVASSSAEHDLHSNWVLRVPRVAGDCGQKAVRDRPNERAPKKKSQSGSTSSRLRLQRNPIHLPKVVESAFQTLRFKPKLKKPWSSIGHLEPPALLSPTQFVWSAKAASRQSALWNIQEEF